MIHMAKMHLTSAEKETILLTSEADDTWEVYTFNESIKKKFNDFADKYPSLCKVVSSDDILGSETFLIQKSRISIRLNEPWSEDRRKTYSERGKTVGVNSLPQRKE